MSITIKCPHCSQDIIVVDFNDSVATVIKNGARQKNGLKVATPEDHKIILTHLAKDWKDISKRDLARKLGLTVGQISAICAWTHPTLVARRRR